MSLNRWFNGKIVGNVDSLRTEGGVSAAFHVLPPMPDFNSLDKRIDNITIQRFNRTKPFTYRLTVDLNWGFVISTFLKLGLRVQEIDQLRIINADYLLPGFCVQEVLLHILVHST